MKRAKGGSLGLIFVMLGAGLILAMIFPSKFLVKSPKRLGGLLRLIFGIKKTEV